MKNDFWNIAFFRLGFQIITDFTSKVWCWILLTKDAILITYF